MKRIIYDIGANNGDDIPYYLMKADLVIAVEANPALCQQMRGRFQSAIEGGKLVVENCVLTDEATTPQVAFYVHKKNHVLSQYPKPDRRLILKFRKIHVPAVHLMDLLQRHGKPYYFKTDIEHFDEVILKCLFENQVFPTYLSTEYHSQEIYHLMAHSGDYNAFKLIYGSSVAQTYKDTSFKSRMGETMEYSFPDHAAGPFEEDIQGGWLSATDMYKKLKVHGCGWKDLHAANLKVETSHFDYENELKIAIKEKKIAEQRRRDLNGKLYNFIKDAYHHIKRMLKM